jgi:uncharacterized SAM-binding protein YcdF (DUF218 family)
MASYYFSSVLGTLLVPPGFFLILLLGAWLLPWQRIKLALLWLTFISIYLLSSGWVAGWLEKSLEIAPPLSLKHLPAADAIVVLGGGRHIDMPEYGGDTVNEITLERLRYAAYLYKAAGLPILVSGGMPGGGHQTEGQLMKRVLEHDFRVPVTYTETRSLTTWDNAANSASILKNAGVHRILLVTHACDERRAAMVFRLHGFDVIPAGTGFARVDLDNPREYLPDARSLLESSWALHEWLGLLWYKLRIQIEGQS